MPRVQVRADDPQQREHGVEIRCRQLRDPRLDTRERRSAPDGRGRGDLDRTDRRPEHEGAVAEVLRQCDGGRDRRVAAERHLGDRGEVADAAVPPVARDEGRLGVADVGGDPLHLGVGEDVGAQHDTRGIAPRRIVGESRPSLDRGSRHRVIVSLVLTGAAGFR